jgi:ABC-2 type transport system ATP-binding protein
MEEPTLKIEHLSHRYSNQWAIRDINMEIHQTGIVGLLGSNGAGKSTTMNILCGVLNQTEGNVFIGGTDLRKEPEAAKQKLGFLPQTPPLYMDLTVEEYLRYSARMRSIEGAGVRPAVDEAMERCGIAHFNKRLIRNLSGGYRQRVGIAQAIIHHPRLVVLDEPTNGLDPNQIIEVRGLIREIATTHAVIFSTHILSEVQVLCKDILMIEGGRIVFADTMDAFNNYVAPNSILLHMEELPSGEELLQVEGISKVDFLTDRQIRLFYSGERGITERIIIESVRRGWRLSEISLEKSSLDEVFAQLSKNTK